MLGLTDCPKAVHYLTDNIPAVIDECFYQNVLSKNAMYSGRVSICPVLPTL